MKRNIKLPNIQFPPEVKNLIRQTSRWDRKQTTVILLVAISVMLFIFEFMSGTRPLGGSEQTITIAEGMRRTDIANELYNKHVIRSRSHFLIVSYLSSKPIKSGIYSLSPNDGLFEIVESLKLGEHALARVTVPEGWRREQIASALSKEGFDGVGFLRLTEGKEGYLFPDTYFFKKGALPEEIVSKFSENFQAKTKDLNLTREQLILASIIERESNRDDQRPIISGIYLNRIKNGISLEADPTVQYAKDSLAMAAGQLLETFWPKITIKDYKSVQSSYNTYLISAYPPGPICNPGLESMKAAMNPQPTDDFYFFHTADGQLITSKTFEEHRAKVRKYM